MKIACFAFTDSGFKIAKILEEKLKEEVKVFEKQGECKKHVEEAFREYDALVFISSTGIAVRLIAPFVKSKTKDPAVVVVDDLGRYSISLLSGHLGGANELADTIGSLINAVPIITTASDGRGIEAVDMFAKRNGFIIESMEDAKKITSLMVNNRPIKLVSEIPVSINYGNTNSENPEGYIAVTSKEIGFYEGPCCILRPRNLNIGIGCRRGKTKEEILYAINEIFKTNNLSLKSVRSAGSVEIKKDEKGIIEACIELGIEYKTFTCEEIKKVEDRFSGSEFVLKNVGVASVSETSAYLLGGEIIVPKTAVNGVTVAVSKED